VSKIPREAAKVPTKATKIPREAAKIPIEAANVSTEAKSASVVKNLIVSFNQIVACYGITKEFGTNLTNFYQNF
jgi:hypothetical protein